MIASICSVNPPTVSAMQNSSETHQLWYIGSQSDGYYVKQTPAGKQLRWVSASCRQQLTAAGIGTQQVSYSLIPPIPLFAHPWPSCDAIAQEVQNGSGNNPGGPSNGGNHGNLEKYPITQGTTGRAPMPANRPAPNNPEPGHGVRVYCPVSHFSYDDPVVKPGQPGKAHLHMFWGNTSTDAYTNLNSLKRQNSRTSCEGGKNNLSAYWAPAVFDKYNQPTIPEEIVVYYKSFGSGNFDRQTIKRIPDGLEMLADRSIPNSQYNLRVDEFRGNLELKIIFPNCVETRYGKPVLRASQSALPGTRKNRHLAYSTANTGRSNNCPSSHPYRIPQLQYNLRYGFPKWEKWQLASDSSPATKGETLHADYIAAWDWSTMTQLVDCNIEMHRECQFMYGPNHRSPRSQLPERFRSANGTTLYSASTQLLPSTDRTPFGATLPKTRH